MKLYIYTTVDGFEGTWDEALEVGMVEVVATIEGNDQNAVERKAGERYGDQDTFGWTYSDGIKEAEKVDRIEL